jgi:hypothetical protein
MAATAARPVGSMTGAATEHAAIDQFMAAVKAEDLQAMGAVWGDKDGPARERLRMDEWQKRELIMLCYLKHDSFKILSDAPSLNGNRVFAVEVRFGAITHTGQFVIVHARNGRYYVQDIPDLQQFEDVCATK